MYRFLIIYIYIQIMRLWLYEIDIHQGLDSFWKNIHAATTCDLLCPIQKTSSLASMERSNVSLATSHENCPCALGDRSSQGRTELETSVNICELEIHQKSCCFPVCLLKFLLRLLSHGSTKKLLPWPTKKTSKDMKTNDLHPQHHVVTHTHTHTHISCCSWDLLSL